MIVQLEKNETFDIKQTLECGQVFRFREEDGGYRIFALGHSAKIKEADGCYELDCDDADFFTNYFDFVTDYALIQSKLQDKGMLSAAMEFGRGIHILRQDPVEAIFSFIVSQNNHIPRIKGIIERICDALGEDCGDYRAFPSVERLAGAGEDFYASIGAGYRAAYLDRVAKTLVNEDVADWQKLDTPKLREKLTSLHGVGRKVADCALLFGFRRFDVFPVDTWIKKVFENDYPDVAADKLSAMLVDKYGEYSGFAQQWLFYFKREQKNV